MKEFTLVFIAALTVLILTGCPEPDSGQDSVQDPVTYVVVYNGNGNTSGTAPADSAVYEEGSIITVLDNIDFVKTGVKFSGWNTEPDGSGIDQAAGSAFILGNANVLLFAKWIDYSVGDIGPAGGTVFYDDTIGYDFDEDDTIQEDEKNFMTDRYLEAAPSDQNGGSQIIWSNISNSTTGATGQFIGTGETNTSTIIGFGDCTSGAVFLCDDLSITNYGIIYDDWLLPSMNELIPLHDQKGVIGGITNDKYWSSSEIGSTLAGNRNLSDGGGSSSNLKSLVIARVRAIRAF